MTGVCGCCGGSGEHVEGPCLVCRGTGLELMPLPNVPRFLGSVDALTRANAAADDWSKATLDLPVKSAEELRAFLQSMGYTVEHFKTLSAYTLALASGKYPWLKNL